MVMATDNKKNESEERDINFTEESSEEKPKFVPKRYPRVWEMEIFKSQIPGGMLSNMESQLKQMVRPEVVAHEKKDVGPDQFEQPFCAMHRV